MQGRACPTVPKDRLPAVLPHNLDAMVHPPGLDDPVRQSPGHLNPVQRPPGLHGANVNTSDTWERPPGFGGST